MAEFHSAIPKYTAYAYDCQAFPREFDTKCIEWYSALHREGTPLGTGKRIREVRLSKGYDQGELARLAGVSASTLWRIETEDRTPRGVTLRKIAEILGVEVAALRESSE
jgi:DNA-binding XRE family transcriptional regulator